MAATLRFAAAGSRDRSRAAASATAAAALLQMLEPCVVFLL